MGVCRIGVNLSLFCHLYLDVDVDMDLNVDVKRFFAQSAVRFRRKAAWKNVYV